jgi:hypothetical protein
MSSLKIFPRYLRRPHSLPLAHCHFSILKNPESSSPLVQSTWKWFQSVVLQEKLCPFAPPLVGNEMLRIVESDAQTDDAMVQDVKQEVESLMIMSSSAVTHETTLVVFSKGIPFLDFVRLSWRWQEEAVADHVEDLQVVLFHPHATHQTYSEMTSASDYTIRSPYPTVHLLREVDVMKAIQSGYPDLENLPARNKEKLEAQGLEVCEQRVAACYTTADGETETL